MGAREMARPRHVVLPPLPLPHGSKRHSIEGLAAKFVACRQNNKTNKQISLNTSSVYLSDDQNEEVCLCVSFC